jgi:hypothetical protein
MLWMLLHVLPCKVDCKLAWRYLGVKNEEVDFEYGMLSQLKLGLVLLIWMHERPGPRLVET